MTTIEALETARGRPVRAFDRAIRLSGRAHIPSAVLGLVLCVYIPGARAQERPVVEWADWASYGTALVNPGVAAYKAARSARPGCRLARLALSEGLGNGISLAAKALYHGPAAERPCVGCDPDGIPSGHATNGTIGAIDAGWAVGASLAVGTGALRRIANRHFIRWQVLAGWALGAAADWAGHLLLPCEGS